MTGNGAVKVFDGPTLERLDDRFEYPEERFYAIGFAEGRLVTVIYTDLDEQIRRGIKADPGVHPTDETFWETAKVVLPQPKETMTIRLDKQVVEIPRLLIAIRGHR